MEDHIDGEVANLMERSEAGEVVDHRRKGESVVSDRRQWQKEKGEGGGGDGNVEFGGEGGGGEVELGEVERVDSESGSFRATRGGENWET
nr:hypothetical protein Iba_chr14dCG3110 [Ipomoea batatas]